MDRIDKNNYEAFMLDYLEGTISPQDKTQLLLFLEQYPELKEDLDTDISLSLQEPVNNHKCDFKIQLKKHPADEYELSVQDYLCIKHFEEGLTKEEDAELVLIEPDAQQRQSAIKSYSQMVLKPDQQVIYASKKRLLRFVMWPAIKQILVNRSAAAVAVMAFVATIWLWQHQNTDAPVLAEKGKDRIEIDVPELAEAKIVEKVLTNETKPSKDSLLKLANDPMELKAGDNAVDDEESIQNNQSKQTPFLASIADVECIKTKPINAYEYGLNVMMPQYMNNNLLKQELVAFYRKVEDEERNDSDGLSLALVENGVKLMNFFSKESVKMQKYYNADGKVVGYQVKGENVEVDHRVK